MNESNFDLMESNELSKSSRGGTELQMRRLYDGSVPRELLSQFQIIPSRVRELDPDKFRILWCHDLPGDPEADQALRNNHWERYHYIVFVSNHQMQQYINRYNLPWSKCVVMHNAIIPIPLVDHPPVVGDPVRLIYHTTPHRGLNVLLPVFDRLYQDHKNIHLDVYSSFSIYGWDERDAEYQSLFDFCNQHEAITYHGAKSNEEVRDALIRSDIFAYPSTWPETSCLALIEAMSAGLVCVHPNFGALYETAGNWTYMYQMNEELTKHAAILHGNLDNVIRNIDSDGIIRTRQMTKQYADSFYNWESRKLQWEALLRMIVANNPDKAMPSEKFVYSR